MSSLSVHLTPKKQKSPLRLLLHHLEAGDKKRRLLKALSPRTPRRTKSATPPVAPPNTPATPTYLHFSFDFQDEEEEDDDEGNVFRTHVFRFGSVASTRLTTDREDSAFLRRSSKRRMSDIIGARTRTTSSSSAPKLRRAKSFRRRQNVYEGVSLVVEGTSRAKGQAHVAQALGVKKTREQLVSA